MLWLVLLVTLGGCKTLYPSNYRMWAPDQSRLPYAEFHGNEVTVHNVRYCKYVTADNYIVDHYDKTYDLRDVTSVDFIVVPFEDMPMIAHTMLSFGFQDRDYLCLSVEIRKEQGEAYSAAKGFFRQYELMYVLGDERDLIQLCAVHRGENVYLHRTRATPAQARALLMDVLGRANKLVDEPEFYNTLTNNCTTNIAQHVNHLWPDRVPYQLGVLLPGYADRTAHRLGLLATNLPLEKAREQANISLQARQYMQAADFSQRIRR